jgi:glucose/arabinose dehydrogenase
MSFDPQTGQLWVGDVGQDRFEEVNLGAAGANYGWSIAEGAVCLDDACEAAHVTAPVYTYSHDRGCSITGGVVYRGRALPELGGRYLFADFCEREVWALDAHGVATKLTETSGHVVSFAPGHDGEVFLLQLEGLIVRLGPRG